MPQRLHILLSWLKAPTLGAFTCEVQELPKGSHVVDLQGDSLEREKKSSLSASRRESQAMSDLKPSLRDLASGISRRFPERGDHTIYKCC